MWDTNSLLFREKFYILGFLQIMDHCTVGRGAVWQDCFSAFAICLDVVLFSFAQYKVAVLVFQDFFPPTRENCSISSCRCSVFGGAEFRTFLSPS